MGEALAEARSRSPRASARTPRSPSSTRRWSPGPTTACRRSNDPTAHAVVVALREAARKLGRDRLADATIFTTLEPCAMCVGALLESDVEALVFAIAERRSTARPDVIQLAQHPDLPRRIRSSAASAATRPRSCSRHDRDRLIATPRGWSGRPAPDLWYPLPRRGVRVVDGAALEKRCAKAPRVRIPPSPPGLVEPAAGRPRHAGRLRFSPGRGRLVDYGAALEMRFGATRRGFESRPLRHAAGRRARP